MSDVQFTIGGSPAPFMSVMEEVKHSAKESAEKVTESFGIEGVKSEKALHGRLTNAFKDLTSGGKTSAEAIGGAFENMTEGLRLSMGGMIALLVFTELVKSAYEGYEAMEKMKTGIKDATSINATITKKSLGDVNEGVNKFKTLAEQPTNLNLNTEAANEAAEKTGKKVAEEKTEIEVPAKLAIDNYAANQSIEEVQDTIKKLRADADGSNLSAQSSLTAGWEVLIQSFEEGKSIMATVKEDAENYVKLQKEAHDLEDSSGAHTIQNANAVLELKAEGHDKEAEALAHEQEMQEKLLEAGHKHNEETEAALHRQIDLEQKIADQQARKDAASKEAKLEELEMAVHAEQLNRGSEQDKLKLAHETEEHDKAAFGDANTRGTDPIDIEQKRLEWEKSITAEGNLQKSIKEKIIKEWQEANNRDGEAAKKRAEEAKKALEVAEQRKKLAEEAKEAQTAIDAAKLDATAFHGEASSLAKIGLGGRVSGANYGNGAQLKAAQDAAKHLADIKADMKKLSGSVGVAGT